MVVRGRHGRQPRTQLFEELRAVEDVRIIADVEVPMRRGRQPGSSRSRIDVGVGVGFALNIGDTVCVLLVLRGGALGARRRRGYPALAVQLPEGGEEDDIHASGRPISGPRSAQISRQEVRLVHQQQQALAGKPVLHIALKVAAPVELGVAAVHDLHQEVAPLDASPQLPPEVDVPFVRRHHHMVLFLDSRQAAAPLQECLALLLHELLSALRVLPHGPPRDGDDDAPRRLGQGLDVGHGVVLGFDDPRALLDEAHAPLGLEGGAGQCGLREEVVQAALLQH
mmetsp:Transcript_103129/g.298354  ORF Transcript_103129/g.298354 Transcript_103129/m.298354 type:complete len:282 (-) Transcript_103129:250-1095(-)